MMGATRRKWDFFDHVRSKESMVDIAPTTSTAIVQQQRQAISAGIEILYYCRYLQISAPVKIYNVGINIRHG
jgi:hypothetical protein